MATHAFLPTRGNAAAIIGINAGMINLSPVTYPATGSSAYNASKIAQAKLLEHVAAENPDVFVVSVHPGVVKTNLLKNAVIEMKDFPYDDGEFALGSGVTENRSRHVLSLIYSEFASTFQRLGHESRSKIFKGQICVCQLVCA